MGGKKNCGTEFHPSLLVRLLLRLQSKESFGCKCQLCYSLCNNWTRSLQKWGSLYVFQGSQKDGKRPRHMKCLTTCLVPWSAHTAFFVCWGKARHWSLLGYCAKSVQLNVGLIQRLIGRVCQDMGREPSHTGSVSLELSAECFPKDICPEIKFTGTKETQETERKQTPTEGSLTSKCLQTTNSLTFLFVLLYLFERQSCTE